MQYIKMFTSIPTSEEQLMLAWQERSSGKTALMVPKCKHRIQMHWNRATMDILNSFHFTGVVQRKPGWGITPLFPIVTVIWFFKQQRSIVRITVVIIRYQWPNITCIQCTCFILCIRARCTYWCMMKSRDRTRTEKMQVDLVSQN